MRILGLDPGTRKCGYAVLSELGAAPLELGIVPLAGLATALAGLLARFPIDIVAIGHGTNAGVVSTEVAALGLAFVLVDERETTLRARWRFFADHPPQGWKRFIPRGMLVPDRPIDDYAALLIAERYLRAA